MERDIILMFVEAALAVIGIMITILFSGVRKDLSSISKSVIDLNIKIEKVITDQSWHKEEIRDIKNRLDAIEKG